MVRDGEGPASTRPRAPTIRGVYLWMYGYEDTVLRAGPRAADIRSARAQHGEGDAMMPWWVLAVFVLGANFAWGSVGLIRLGESVAGGRRAGRPGPLAWPARACLWRPPPAWPARRRAGAGPANREDGNVMAVTAERAQPGRPRSLTTVDLAVLAAHNEGPVIEESLRSIMALAPRTTTWSRTAPPTPRSRSPGPGRSPGDRDPGERGRPGRSRRPSRTPHPACRGGHAALDADTRGRARLLHRRRDVMATGTRWPAVLLTAPDRRMELQAPVDAQYRISTPWASGCEVRPDLAAFQRHRSRPASPACTGPTSCPRWR